MRIGIDARFYGAGGKGLGRYVSELIVRLETLDKDNEYVVFLRRENFDEYRPSGPRFTKALAEFPWYGWKEQLVYPFWLARHRLDLMHFAHFNVPVLYRRPFVVTVHDLILLSHPTPRATTLGPLLYRMKYFFYRLVIRSALRRAEAVITVSQCTKSEIEKNFPFTKKKKIFVTYEACGTAFRSGSGTPSKVQQPFVLYVGNAYPHKNLERLVSAFAGFRRSHPEYRLALVGGSDYFYERLKRETEAKGLSENVVFAGQVDDAELAGLYDAAAFYVFPSLCEGFGLPPLEAMCRGLAVASSNAACLPEILGDAALYFDPADERSIAAAMRRLANDQPLRAELIAKGRSRAAGFDWDKCAGGTLEAYRQALQGRNKRP